MTVLNILIEARARVERPELWHQGSDECGDAVCAGNAIHLAGIAYGSWDTTTRAVDAFRRSASMEGRTVVEWNDDPKRTHAEVLAAFDRAIEAQRSIPSAQHGVEK